jgi:hypothetical protein
MKVFGLLIAMISLNTFAANKYYDIGMDLSVGGKKIQTPRILAKDKVTETVIQGKNFFEVTATENPLDQTVKMDFVVGEFAEDGTRVILERPTIIAKENKRAEMIIKQNDGPEELKLSVVPIVKEL